MFRSQISGLAKFGGLRPTVAALYHRARYAPYAIAAAIAAPQAANAQSVQTTETGSIQLMQYGVDVLMALSGLTGIYYLYRAGTAMTKAARDQRGEITSTHIATDIGAGVFLFAIGIVLYIAKTQLFGSGATAPTLNSISITPSGA